VILNLLADCVCRQLVSLTPHANPYVKWLTLRSDSNAASEEATELSIKFSFEKYQLPGCDAVLPGKFTDVLEVQLPPHSGSRVIHTSNQQYLSRCLLQIGCSLCLLFDPEDGGVPPKRLRT
jgi:hypothetical protein